MVPPEEAEPELPDYIIERARSGRSKCKTCKKLIEKDELRLGVLVEGPYGMGHMWHHIPCAAGRMLDKVEAAYAAEAWNNAKTPPDPADLPKLEELRDVAVVAEREREEKAKNRKVIPYAEVAPSNRSKCKQSGEAIPLGAVRIVLGKEAVFGNQSRTAPFAVLPQFVADACADPDVTTDPLSLADELRANSKIDSALLDEAISAIGDLN